MCERSSRRNRCGFWCSEIKGLERERGEGRKGRREEYAVICRGEVRERKPKSRTEPERARKTEREMNVDDDGGRRGEREREREGKKGRWLRI